MGRFGKIKQVAGFILIRGLGFVGGAFTAFIIFILLGLLLVLLKFNLGSADDLILPIVMSVTFIGGVIGAFYADFYIKVGLAVWEHWP